MHTFKPTTNSLSTSIELLFLDFDGVLHPGNSGTFRYVKNFQRILDMFPNVGVVFSTSWRHTHSLETLKSDYFEQKYLSRFKGITPTSHSRENEILDYCRVNRIRNFLAIDDDASLFPSSPSWLYLIEGKLALNEANTNALIQHLLMT